MDLDNDLIVNLQSVAVVAKRDNGKFDVVTPSRPIGGLHRVGTVLGRRCSALPIFLISLLQGAAIGARAGEPSPGSS
ncbi:MAG: hypothetical protein ACLTDR_08725 [Adlercreutzia equolifaciens]